MEEEAAGLSSTGSFERRRPSRWRNVLLFLAVIGPGIITANVDNDAGGITTYSLAGAQFGTKLLWTLIPITVALIVVQEMSARMGAVTGKGLADLIRENFGVKLTFYLMVALLVANYGNTVSEFAGVAASMELFGVSKWISVPVAAALIWVLVVRGTYRLVERIFLVACVFYFVYPVSAFLAHPVWREVLRDTLIPSQISARLGLRRDARRPRRHDDRAVDAVLPAVERRREGDPPGQLLDLALGRHRGLHRDGRRRVLHHRRLRRDAPRARRRRSTTRRPPRGRSSRWLAGTPRRSSPSVCSMRRSSRPPSCRSRPSTTSARPSAGRRASTRSGRTPAPSTGSTRR